MTVQFIKYWDQSPGRGRVETLEPPKNARISEGCVYYYRDYDIHSVYKAYRLREGECVEIEYHEDVVWED